METEMKWTAELATGIDIIDTQHKVMLDLANDLKRAYENNAGAQVLDTMFGVIMHYSFQHLPRKRIFSAAGATFISTATSTTSCSNS